ncbi:cupin domain-containing protein [Tumebacillus sp. ITR2]|uniref:Cupin domain-containing protein n=1 Tax=Tumebacillus amylolyticus TaxID=2801339 RepID=A0ABS1J8S4_9BACL|nr:cupin domain-containing protein [Tumebacillus amylolyticus]MBL0386666.1 cupin domain-containing protein [Tumebacillus amylolyticus]
MEMKGGIVQGENFTAAHAGPWDEMMDYVFSPAPQFKFPGKVFLNEALGLNGMEVSLGVMKPGTQVPYAHEHKQNEELYIFVKGKGQFYIDGQVLEVGEGSTVRVAPNGVRCWRNNSSEDLHYIVIQAKEGSLSQYTLTDGKMTIPQFQWPE